MKQELINTIATLEKQLAEAKEKLSKCGEQWHPKGGIWTCLIRNNLVMTSGTAPSWREAGLESQTEKAAEKKLKAIRQFARLYSLAEELNEGWEPDWNNDTQEKWYIFCEFERTWATSLRFRSRALADVYFKSKEVAIKAIELITNNNALETNV